MFLKLEKFCLQLESFFGKCNSQQLNVNYVDRAVLVNFSSPEICTQYHRNDMNNNG